ncbi:MAG: phage shock protein [Actinomycetota bacterium]|jgi:phage shock protein PspC (stress-responsive transcriptional regulator)|nr:phage shock protein [Actinomycetota bacterium]
MDNIHRTFAQHGLVRARHGRVLGGVCAGLGRRVGLDPWPARLLFVLVLLAVPGCQLLVYPLLWILMPSEAKAARLQASAHPATGAPAA